MSDRCLCIDLRSAAHKLTQIYDEAMAPSGLSVTQFSLLHLIQSHEEPTLTALSGGSGLDRSTLGRNIKVLERMGLVSSSAGTDARSRVVRLTGQGARAFKRAVPLWRSVQTELAGRIGSDGRGRLDDLLAALTAPLAIQTA